MKKTKPGDEETKVVMDGMTFYVPDGHVPLQTFHNALMLYLPSGTEGEAGLFTAVFEQTHTPKWERKYTTFGRIQSWVRKEVDSVGGIKKLDPDKERLLVAIWEADNPNRRDPSRGSWLFGRLVRNHIGRTARALIQIEGESAERECRWHSSFDRVFICDDPRHVDELNEAEAQVREAIDHRDQLQKKYLKRVNTHMRRAGIVKLAKKQMRRIKARMRRAAPNAHAPTTRRR